MFLRQSQLIGNFRTRKGHHTGPLQSQFFIPGELLFIENRLDGFFGLLLAFFALLPHLFEALGAFFFAEIAEAGKIRPLTATLAEVGHHVVDQGLLIVGDGKFLLNFRHVQDHEFAAATAATESKAPTGTATTTTGLCRDGTHGRGQNHPRQNCPR
ncbi:hypothetical protein GC163_03605 [bacterium]|nr:hypothetical protein [bacterium]